MIVLGLHFGHGAAAVLVVEGKVSAAIEEEKLNRVKGYVGFPFKAVDYVLESGKVGVADVDYVAIGAENLAEFSYCFIHQTRQIFRVRGYWEVKARFLDLLKYLNHSWDSSALLERNFYSLLELTTGIDMGKVVKVNHHLAHAASAFYCSSWAEALVVTADGKGDGLCGGAYLGNASGLHCLDSVADRYSVGQFYQAVTKYLGYKVNRHEGKITGLSAFGASDVTWPMMDRVLGGVGDGEMYNRLYESDGLEQDPVAFYKREVEETGYVKPRHMRILNGDLRKYAIVHQLYQNYLKTAMGGFAPEDLAAGVQKLSEEFFGAYVHRFLDRIPEGRLCLAGGVFANVKVNQRIRELAGVENFFVQPAMDDAGCALGAALHVAAARGGLGERPVMNSIYQGPGFSVEEIEKHLREAGVCYRRSVIPEEEIAQAIHEGRVVGRYTGALEWGPRALGNRSILMRPTERGINAELNKRLHRTEFMPFAPSIMSEYADDYLVGYRECDLAARYMTVTYDIRPDQQERIAAAVHIDGTARPQVVFKKDQPNFHKIIKEYHRLSEIPAILNTSFNMHEEPIVNSPEDAIKAFHSGAVDVLSMGPFIVDSSG